MTSEQLQAILILHNCSCIMTGGAAICVSYLKSGTVWIGDLSCVVIELLNWGFWNLFSFLSKTNLELNEVNIFSKFREKAKPLYSVTAFEL